MAKSQKQGILDKLQFLPGFPCRVVLPSSTSLVCSTPRLAVCSCHRRQHRGSYTSLHLSPSLPLLSLLLLPLLSGLRLLRGRRAALWTLLKCCMQPVPLHQQVRKLQQDMPALQRAAAQHAAAYPGQGGQQGSCSVIWGSQACVELTCQLLTPHTFCAQQQQLLLQ